MLTLQRFFLSNGNAANTLVIQGMTPPCLGDSSSMNSIHALKGARPFPYHMKMALNTVHSPVKCYANIN